jgi:fucose permease
VTTSRGAAGSAGEVRRGRSAALLLVLAYAGFASIGLPDGLLGVAAPSILVTFGLGLDALGALLVSYTAGYLAASVASGRVLTRHGVGSVLAWSCLATAASLLGYALAQRWVQMVALGSLAGFGAGAVDAGLNTFAATRHGVRTLNWLHACYGLGTTSGPLLMSAVLAAGRPWQLGYVVVSVGQLFLAACFAVTRARWPAPGAAAAGTTLTASLRATLGERDVWLGVATFAAYTGIEAAAGVWAYSFFTQSRRVSPALAAAFVSAYWASFTVGRIVLGAIAEHVALGRFVRASVVSILAGATMLWLGPDTLGLVGLVLLGVGCAPVFPSLMAATPARVGPAHAANAIGLQVCGGTIGASALPALIGLLAARAGLDVLGPALVAAALVRLALTWAARGPDPRRGE